LHYRLQKYRFAADRFLKMSITRATVTDVAELTRLINSAYRGESSQRGWTSEAHLLGGIRIDEETLTQYINDPTSEILKYTNEEGQIIGCVYLQVSKGKRLYLGMLTVSPGLQTNGIGRQLLHEAEIVAHQLKCRTIFMTVITTRLELISWYERRGYHATGKMVPFPTDNKFGTPNQHIELGVYEKDI
jgi:N-acetylglutamate synthase-like GNAT family acetyltransferase